MKKKWIVAVVVAVMLTAFSTTAFAAAKYSTPAEAVAGLTGRTLQSVLAERKSSGKTYGTMAKEAGVLDEFKQEVLEQKKDRLAVLVSQGKITQAKADQIIKQMEQHQQICDGTGKGCLTGGLCVQDGLCGGNGSGQGKRRPDGGRGNGGRGGGNGGRGGGLRDGSCIAK